MDCQTVAWHYVARRLLWVSRRRFVCFKMYYVAEIDFLQSRNLVLFARTSEARIKILTELVRQA